jgi:hypothetical protein
MAEEIVFRRNAPEAPEKPVKKAVAKKAAAKKDKPKK